MKIFQRLCAALMLTLVLTLSAFAGEISTSGVYSSPPDPQATSTGDISTPSVTGEMSAGVTSTDTTTTEAVLSLVQTLLALF